jgi:hypothetical protein
VDANYNPLCVLLEEISFHDLETNKYVPKFPKVYDGSQNLSEVTKKFTLIRQPSYFEFLHFHTNRLSLVQSPTLQKVCTTDEKTIVFTSRNKEMCFCNKIYNIEHSVLSLVGACHKIDHIIKS